MAHLALIALVNPNDIFLYVLSPLHTTFLKILLLLVLFIQKF